MGFGGYFVRVIRLSICLYSCNELQCKEHVVLQCYSFYLTCWCCYAFGLRQSKEKLKWVKKKNNVGAAVLGLVILTGTRKRDCKNSQASWKCSLYLVCPRLRPFI